MRRRRDDFFVALYGIALAILTAAACNPQVTARSVAGMSAPPAPRISVVSTPLCNLPSSHACGHAGQQRTTRLEAPAPLLAGTKSVNRAKQAHRHYGPLYRRPPPIFS